VAAHPGHRRRTDQPRGVDVVPHGGRRLALPDRGYLVADRDRRTHDFPAAGATPTKPGSCTFPLPGIMAAIVDETGQDVDKGKGGILVIKRPWPGMIRTIWGDPERYKKSYYPEDFKGKYYLAGDGASRDLEGY